MSAPAASWCFAVAVAAALPVDGVARSLEERPTIEWKPPGRSGSPFHGYFDGYAAAMAVECASRWDGDAQIMVVSGDLAVRDAAEVRTRLLCCLAERPAVLVADVSRLTVVRPAALAVFRAVARQAARWPGAPLALSGADRRTQAMVIRKGLRRVPVFAGVEAARNHFAGRRGLVAELSDELLPLTGSVRQARDAATDACLRWNLPRLLGPACLIADELTANVVDHAGTMANLSFGLHDRFLAISVRDGSCAAPEKGGRGLGLVEAFARHWGFLPAAGGKVVWAALPR